MTAPELLDDLTRAGVVLSVENGSLRFLAPPGIITPERAKGMAEHKAALIDLLDRPVLVGTALGTQWDPRGGASTVKKADLRKVLLWQAKRKGWPGGEAKWRELVKGDDETVAQALLELDGLSEDSAVKKLSSRGAPVDEG